MISVSLFCFALHCIGEREGDGGHGSVVRFGDIGSYGGWEDGKMWHTGHLAFGGWKWTGEGVDWGLVVVSMHRYRDRAEGVVCITHADPSDGYVSPTDDERGVCCLLAETCLYDKARLHFIPFRTFLH